MVELNNKTQEFIKKAREVHDDRYDYSLVDYKNSKSTSDIICKIHGKFKQNLYRHIYRKIGCSKCNRKGHSKLTTQEFIKKAKEVHIDIYDYSLVDYKNYKSNVKIICKDHGIFNQNGILHISLMRGCPKCAGNIKLTTQEFIKKAREVHDDRYDYSLVTYINSGKKIKIICKIHGVFEATPNSHNSMKSGCPKCNSSKGENTIREILNKNNIIFIEQYKFKECKNIRKLSFDFYLSDLNICIEYDGKQHFKSNNFFGGIKELQKQQLNDLIKEQFCDLNNIKLIRWDYLNNITIK